MYLTIKNITSIAAFCFIGICAIAQQVPIESIAGQCSTEHLKKNLFYLASDAMEGRLTASHGDTLASLFVAKEFKDAGLTAPYAGSYMQRVPILLQKDRYTFSFGNKTYSQYNGWTIYPSNAVLNAEKAPIILLRIKTNAQLISYLDTAVLKDKILLIPSALMFDYIESRAIDSLDLVLQKKGALALLWANQHISTRLQWSMKRNFLPVMRAVDSSETRTPVTNFPELIFTPAQINLLLLPNGTTVNNAGNLDDTIIQSPLILSNTLTVQSPKITDTIYAPNVIGIFAGTDTAAGCIVVSAHHDHDGHNGNVIYHGAVDNGSGTVAIIEMAHLLQLAAKKGLHPKRTIVFASFTGEERGLLGSFFYADNPVIPIANTFAELNIDMAGRVDTLHENNNKADSNYIYTVTKDAAGNIINASLQAANNYTHLVLDGFYQNNEDMFMRSDHYPLSKKGVPVIFFDCGFFKDWHEPSDTPDKIDYNLLQKQTQLAFLTMWNLSNK